MGCLYQAPPLKAQGSMLQRHRGKTIRARHGGDPKQTVSSSHNRTEAHMTSQSLWQHAQDLIHSNQSRSSTEWGKWTQIPPHPQPRSHLQLILAGKTRVSFLQRTVTGCINHTVKQAPCPGVGGQHKMNCMGSSVCLLACFLGRFEGGVDFWVNFALFWLFCMYLIDIFDCSFDFHFMGFLLCLSLFCFIRQKVYKTGWVGMRKESERYRERG